MIIMYTAKNYKYEISTMIKGCKLLL